MGMLGYLSKELGNKRKECSNLRRDLSIQNGKLDNSQLHSANTEATLSAKRLEAQKMFEYNKRHKAELKNAKKESYQLKKSMKEMHESQREQMLKQNEIFKTMRDNHLNEM